MKYVDELFIMLNEDTIFRERMKEWSYNFRWDNSNIQPTHNKDDVEALDKGAPLAPFISFVPYYIS